MEQDLPWWRRPRLLAAAACAALGVIVLALGPLALRAGPPAPAAPVDELALLAEEPPAAEAAPAPPADLIVYVSGAVARPDVYRLPAGARVKDAVVAAGGLLAGAAAEQVNLAAPLSDAAQIHIPRLDEAPAPAAAGAPAAPGDGRLDLNRASAADLEELPGIGATLAGRIIARREEQGPFGSVEELREVTGVGEKLFEQIAPLVTAGG